MWRLIAALICHVFIFVATTVCVIREFVIKGKKQGLLQFRFFTMLSNVFCALICGLAIIYDVKMIADPSFMQPEWLRMLRFISTISVAVTFATVMVFLGPTQGYKQNLKEAGMIVHLITPVLAILSVMWFERTGAFTLAQRAWGLAPTLIYGVVYLYLAVHVGEDKGGWPDFYGFNATGHWPVSFAGMVIGTAVLSFLIGF